MPTLEQIVQKLLQAASESTKSEDALRFSQAALNAAHTKHALADFPTKT